MNHIKDYWVENEVFHASSLNEIAKAINALIDKAEVIIDDEKASSASTYSSVKVIEILKDYGLKTVVVDVLPDVGENNTIYFIPLSDPTEEDATEEFIWCDGKWEKIGSTKIDFSKYYTKDEIDETVDTIEGLIADKADFNHTHSIGEIDNLESALSGKSNIGHTHSEYSPTSHTHSEYSLTSHTHTAQEVGALPSSTTIPTKTSELINDSGFITETTTYSAGTNIEITGTENTINAIGYVYDKTKSSFATGLNNTASGNYSHAEGNDSEATNEFAHAEGNGAHATGPASHAEGSVTWATGNNAHAEGIGTSANGWCAHAEGDGTETNAANSCEHAEGKFNASHTGETDAQKTRHSIGIGPDASHRANAFEVMANGDVYIKGVGDYNGTNPTSAQTVSQVISGKADADHTHTMTDVSGLTETLENFSKVVSSHINEIEENIEAIGFEELAYEEHALYTQESENIMAHGMVSKVGKTVTLQIYNANTIDGSGEVCYRLPYAPNSTYVPIVNSRGLYESDGIYYKISIQNRSVEVNGESVTYPALILVRYVNGSIANWETGQNVMFKVDYITTE